MKCMECAECGEEKLQELPYCELCQKDLCLDCIELKTCESDVYGEHVAGDVRYN